MIRFIFVLSCLMISSVSIFGQTLEADLGRSFNKYSIVKVNNYEALKKAEKRLPFKIKTKDKTFEFILTPNDIRSADYKAEYTDNDGRHNLPRGEVFTYQGTIIGEANSLVALTIDGTKIEGYFATSSEGFFIESAKKYSARASGDDKVIYRVEDKVASDDNICGLDEAVADEMKTANSNADFNVASSPQIGRRILKVATEADKEFVQEETAGNGDPAKANDHILSVMNQVDAVYRRDLNLRVVVTFQHAWMPGSSDPYAGLINLPLLNAFKNYWNANFPSSNPNYRRDIAHLFSRKVSPDERGRAYDYGTVCKPETSYSYSSSLFERWIVVAHELGHNLNANHPDQQTPVPPNCVNTIMQAYPAPYNPTAFCSFSVNEITAFVNTNGSCLDLDVANAKTFFDYDGDDKSDISVFRPSNGVWYLNNSKTGFSAAQFGISSDYIVPADYDNDGRTDIAVYRNGDWYILRSSDGGFSAIQFGISDDLPAPADFDGDGRSELAVYRPSNGTWYWLNLANNRFAAVQFGSTKDLPVVTDYDGDGKSDYAVYRPSSGIWYLLQSTKGFAAIQFGISTDIPVVGDYDGDGRADEAVYRSDTGTWYLLQSTKGFASLQFGVSTDLPVPGDYDGDGKTDIAVFRADGGIWYQMRSMQGFVGFQFGIADDKPTAHAFIP